MRSMLTAMLMATAVAASALTLQEARDAARENYPLVKDYNLLALTEQYTLENASKAWLPQVSAGLQATWQTDVVAYPDVLKEMLTLRGVEMKGMDKLQYKASVDVRQMIWDGGRVSAQKEIAKAESEEARRANDVELYQLQGRVDQLYFSILLLEEQEATITQTITLLSSNLDKVKSLVRNGAAMQSDADAVEVELLSTQQQLQSVKRSITSYKQILGIYIGQKGDYELEEPIEIAVTPSNEANHRPEYLLMSAREATLDAKLKEIKASCMPQIGAFAQGYYGYPGLNFMDAMMNRKPTLNAIIGISASWNISSFYTKKNRQLTLATAADRIEVAKEKLQFNTDIQADQQRNEISRLREISVTDKDITALRTRVRIASEAKLREGVVEPTDLLLRITEEKNSIIAANMHRIQYLQAIYSLQNILNQ